MFTKYRYNGELLSEYELRRAFTGILPLEITEDVAQAWGIEIVPEPLNAQLKRERNSLHEHLKTSFLSYRENAVIKTPLGFPVDAGDRALQDVSGLVVLLDGDETQTLVFMDAENVPHPLTLSDLHVIQKLIVQNGARAYKRKWEIREAIENAKTLDELRAIEVAFEEVEK